MPKKKKSRHNCFAPDTAGLSIRLPKEVKEALKVMADKDHRTLSAFAALELGKLVAR